MNQYIKQLTFTLNSDDFDELENALNRNVKKLMNKFTTVGRRRLILQIDANAVYKAEDGSNIKTTIKDLHTSEKDMAVTRLNYQSHIDDYVDMLMLFCTDMNHGNIGSCGEFKEFRDITITLSRPVAEL